MLPHAAQRRRKRLLPAPSLKSQDWGLVIYGSCYKLNFGALIKQSNSHKRAVLDYLRKVHFKPLVNL